MYGTELEIVVLYVDIYIIYIVLYIYIYTLPRLLSPVPKQKIRKDEMCRVM